MLAHYSEDRSELHWGRGAYCALCDWLHARGALSAFATSETQGRHPEATIVHVPLRLLEQFLVTPET